ncbi:hypothetical protein KAK07_21100 [Ideonella sp. 4Y16]|uniref:4Fe4S-binding leucine-rich repeat protein n=1 Tax=Ideonella alba TaxID=2824118 RepID=UPI001B365814|nr:4Fe4S-binding leucine-rich repeat protein [Ideonella alba]MBQ0945852.1 hypothetical protein [Ideonella alba]
MDSAVATRSPLALRVRAPAGDIPVLDWQGQALDCTHCPHAALRRSGACEPGHSCMQDAYARRIDRFFRAHPTLADRHLAHPYFEVRAIAARHVDVFQLARLRDDPDETVRLQVALRLPLRQLAAMVADPHREVRIRVAQRLDPSALSALVDDPDYEVRSAVARRLPPALLPLLARDPDEQVRRVVAERLEMPTLWRLANDASPRVRHTVAQRAPVDLLVSFSEDPDWSVRWVLADRLDERRHRGLLQELAADEDAEVRCRARERLQGLQPLEALHGGHRA